MITRDEVIYAYRLLLGREPENEAVVERFLPLSNWEELRQAFVACAEFKTKTSAGPAFSADFNMSPGSNVDVEISDEHFECLVKHIQTAWEVLGTERPYWSVLVNPDYLPEKIEAKNVADFYATGESSVHLLEKAAERADKTLPTGGTVFELGCGVGRVTASLARRFKHVIALDISRPHLEITQKHLDDLERKNVTLKQLKSLETLESLEPFDLFYTVIVLQHNPPPLIYRMLQLIFDKVRAGGFVYFQVPVAFPGYNFSIAKYLTAVESGEGTMEMHVLPQVYLFRLLDEGGFRILDLQRDNWAGPAYHSVTVFAEKHS